MIKVCNNPECGREYKTKRESRKYCSSECRFKCIKQAYTDADKRYIIDNYGKIPTKDIAAKFNTTQEALRRCISHWRLNGDTRFPILVRDCKPGDTRTRMERGKEITYVKTEAGNWQRIKIGRTKKEKVNKSERSKAIKPKVVKVPKPMKKEKPVKANKPEKRNMRVLPTRTNDLSKKKPVMIPGNNRTVVYVAMDADPQEVIAKYQEQRKRELMGSRYGI